MVDTGADESLLGVQDANRLGVTHGALAAGIPSRGLGGVTQNLEEPALLVFLATDGMLHVYQTALDVASPGSDVNGLPSLLGRDVLDRWRMDYYPTADRLEFEVISADASRPAS